MSRLDPLFDAALERLADARMRRVLRAVRPVAPGVVERDGRRLLDFSSNDYLGLAMHPALASRSAAWGARWGTGRGRRGWCAGRLPRMRRWRRGSRR